MWRVAEAMPDQPIVSIIRTYVVEGFGEATPPQVYLFSVPIGGKAAGWYGKYKVLGGPGYPLGAPPNLPLGGQPRKSRQ
jgi:hypothetical protein